MSDIKELIRSRLKTKHLTERKMKTLVVGGNKEMIRSGLKTKHLTERKMKTAGHIMP